MGEGPIGVVAQGLVKVVADAVGFDVGLVVDIEPVAVAQCVPVGVVGIMGGSDRTGVSRNSANFSWISSTTSLKFVTWSRGIFSSTSMARLMQRSTSSCSF